MLAGDFRRICALKRHDGQRARHNRCHNMMTYGELMQLRALREDGRCRARGLAARRYCVSRAASTPMPTAHFRRAASFHRKALTRRAASRGHATGRATPWHARHARARRPGLMQAPASAAQSFLAACSESGRLDANTAPRSWRRRPRRWEYRHTASAMLDSHARRAACERAASRCMLADADDIMQPLSMGTYFAPIGYTAR